MTTSEDLGSLLGAEAAILDSYAATRVQFTGLNIVVSGAAIGFFASEPARLCGAWLSLLCLAVASGLIVYRISIGYAFHYGLYEKIRDLLISREPGLVPEAERVRTSYEALTQSPWSLCVGKMPLYVFYPLLNVAVPIAAGIVIGISPATIGAPSP